MKKLIFAIISITLISANALAQKAETKSYFCQDSIKLVEIEPFDYVAYDVTGSYAQHDQAYTALWEESVKQFLPYDHGFFAIYHNSPENTDEKDLKWEVGAKLTEDDVDEILSPLKKKSWAFDKVVEVQYEGPVEGEIGQAYAGAMKYMGENGLQVAGPGLQRYLGRPHPNKEGVMVAKIQIWMPVVAAK